MLLRLLTKVERVFASMSAVFILAMMFLTTVDVVLRYVFNNPIPGNYELQSMMLCAVAFLGLAYIQSQRSHIRMDVLSLRLATTNQMVLRLLGDTLFLLIMVIITWRMGMEAWTAFKIGDYFWGLVKFPLGPPKLAIALGTGLVSLRLIADIITNPLWKKQAETKIYGRYLGVLITLVFFGLMIAGIVYSESLELSTVTIGWISLGLFFVLLVSGASVAASMVLIGVWGFAMLRGAGSALGLAGTVPFTSTAEYTMTVLPLFIVMGSFGSMAGFAQYGFEVARRWLEGITGGIVHATVVGATAFAAATGSSIASCAVLAKVTIPEMIKQGVKKEMAIGVVASAATLAIMIPPSGQFVVYGMITGNSIGQLLIAGIIPGLIGAAMLMLMIYIRIKIDPGIVGLGSASHSTWKERFSAMPRAWGILFIAVVVMGGIYSGIFTPTEAGAIGAFVAFFTMLITKKGNLRELSRALLESGGISSTVLFILVGGMTFGYMISVTQLPAMLSEWVVGLSVAPIIILISIMVMYIILGCFMDTLSTMIITLPIIYPLILGLGFDPIWFGVLMVQNAEIGSVTPPFGMNLFVLKGLLPDTNLGEIFRSVGWFIAPMILTMAIYVAFPQVALWLPGMMAK